MPNVKVVTGSFPKKKDLLDRFFGIVVGTAMAKTIKVLVQTSRPNTRKKMRMANYKEVIFAHDEHHAAVIGDIVMCDRLAYNISSKKSFQLSKIIIEADRYKDPQTGIMFTVPAMGKLQDLITAKKEEKSDVRDTNQQ